MKQHDWINIWIIAIITWIFVLHNQVTFIQKTSYELGKFEASVACLEGLKEIKNSL